MEPGDCDGDTAGDLRAAPPAAALELVGVRGTALELVGVRGAALPALPAATLRAYERHGLQPASHGTAARAAAPTSSDDAGCDKLGDVGA